MAELTRKDVEEVVGEATSHASGRSPFRGPAIFRPPRPDFQQFPLHFIEKAVVSAGVGALGHAVAQSAVRARPRTHFLGTQLSGDNDGA